MTKGYRFLFKALEWFAIICMIIMTIVVFIEVVMRYFLGSGFSWSQEISTLMMVWFGFVGLSIGVLEKIHISIELFTMKLPKKIINIIDKINYLLIGIFGGCMVYFGLIIMDMTKMSTLPATKWPSSVLYFILPLSGLLVFLNSILITAGADKRVRKFIAIDQAGEEE